MARQVLPIVGAVAGFAIGGPTGAQIGFALGSLVGNAVDPIEMQGRKLGDAPTQVAAEGGARAIVFGKGCIRATIILERGGRRHLLDVSGRQFVFEEVISRMLYEGIEFDRQTDEAIRWYPSWPSRTIVIDPHRAFGRPIAARSGVPADILSAAANVEGSESLVARTYNVGIAEVRAAVEWHDRTAA